MSKRPIFSFPPDFGRYMAVVFEFLGFLGLGGVAGYVAENYIWPEYSSWIFPTIFLAMFVLGLWFMIRQTKSLAERKSAFPGPGAEKDGEEELTPDMVEKRMKEFDARFQSSLGHRKRGGPDGSSR